MHGIVSLLDASHTQRVHDLWQALADRWGLRGVAITPIPHFSYHVAERYDQPSLATTLVEIARDVAPFRVRTTGIGVFTASHLVLYLPVVKTLELALFHRTLWHNLIKLSANAQAYYQPDLWVPHITLAANDLHTDQLGEVVRWLSTHDLEWECTVDNLALIHDTGGTHALDLRFDFAGTS